MPSIGKHRVDLARWGVAAVALAVLFGGAAAQYGPTDEEAQSPQDYPEAYADYVERRLVATRAEVERAQSIMSERAEELLDEISQRLQTSLAALPSQVRNTMSKHALPMPASVQRLNEYDRMLGAEVYRIDLLIEDDLIRMTDLRDSLEEGLEEPRVVAGLVDELARSITTNLELWGTKIDLVRSRLVVDGSGDQARQMFAREYNAMSYHYASGNYAAALVRMDKLTEPYGSFPFPEWIESLVFFRAEIQYGLGDWDQAYALYQRTWQDQGNLYSGQAFHNWLELAFAGGRHQQIASAWAVSPRLPNDPLNANRARLLVAESYLRLGEPDAASLVLSQVRRSGLFTERERAELGEYQANAIESANGRLVLYARLLDIETRGDKAYGNDVDGVRPSSRDGADDALMGELSAALGGLGDTPAASSDSIARAGQLAYRVAHGDVSAQRRDYTALDAVIRDLEALTTDVRANDPDGSLLARALMALGQSYFERGFFPDAAAAFDAVPVASGWYPEAQVSRAWAEMEQGDELESLAAITAARKWQLSPTLALETAALNAFVLERMGQVEQSEDQIRRMVMATTIEDRRAIGAPIQTELLRLGNTLRLAGVVALEREQQALYRDVVAEQTKLDTLVAAYRRVERALREYSTGRLDDVSRVRDLMRNERSLLRQSRQAAAQLRRRAGDAPSARLPGDYVLDEKRSRLQSWLTGMRPADERWSESVYRQWADYAKFAYAKRTFEENLRRKARSIELKIERNRIDRLLRASP